MKTYFRGAAIVALLTIGLATGGQAQALNACYVPNVGALYLVGLPGLPGSCLTTSHVGVNLSSGTTALADGAVTTAKIADGAVTGVKIGAGAIGAAHIATDAVGGAEIAAAAVGTAELVDGSVTGVKIATGAIGSSHLATGAVTGVDIAAGAVGSAHIATDAVASSQIAANAVGTSEIANGAVTAAKLAPGAVSLQHTTVFTPLTAVPASASEFAYSVDCPSGYLPMAGVFNKDSYVLQITFSRPTATGWSFRVHNVGSTTRALFMGVYCIRLS